MSAPGTFLTQVSVVECFIRPCPRSEQPVVRGCAEMVPGSDICPWVVHGCAEMVPGSDIGPAGTDRGGGPTMPGAWDWLGNAPAPAARVRSPGSVSPTREAADRAGGDAGGRVDLEEARAPVGAAEEARTGGGDCCGAAPHPAHGTGTTGKGRGSGTGHHGMDTRVAFWRATGGLGLGRGR